MEEHDLMGDALKEALTPVNEEQSTEQQGETIITDNNVQDNSIVDSTNTTEEIEVEENQEENTTEGNSTEESDDTNTDSENTIGGIVDDNDQINNAENENSEENSSEETTNFNFSEILDSQFEDEEDLQNYIEGLELENDTLRETGNTEPAFANDFMKEMNEYVAAGGEASNFMRVQGVDVSTMDSVEALTTELMWNNPGLTKEEAKDFLKDKYSNSLNDDEELDPNNAILKVHANQAKSAIQKLQVEDVTPKVSNADGSKEDWQKDLDEQNRLSQESSEQQREETLSEWLPEVDKAISEAQSKGIKIPLPGTGKAYVYDFKGDEAYVDGLRDRVEDSLSSMGISVKDNPKMANQLLESSIVLDKVGEMIKKAMVASANEKDNEWFNKINNPTAIARGGVPVKGVTLPSKGGGLASLMENG